MDRPGLYEVVVHGDRRPTGKQLYCYFVVAPSRGEAIRLVMNELSDLEEPGFFDKAKAAAFYHNDGMIRVRRHGTPSSEFKTFAARCQSQEQQESLMGAGNA